ncbi:MAG TPA: hypothetical protein PKV50_03480 [Prolixibacteraceae bacterium]|nr:hypothetical protein [Bacteroidales bacterium]HUM88566.1 hypothetical protein [Prolixibacteraceae bacterium]
MKKLTLIITTVMLIGLYSCQKPGVSKQNVTSIQTNKSEQGIPIEFRFFSGKYHNHPTFSVWVEDLEGNYIETLMVTEYVAKGIYGHGSLGPGKWDSKPGPAERPSTLPYWLHKYAKAIGGKLLPSPERPVPDAITSATPTGDFILESVIKNKPEGKFRVMMEINQTWDWNEFWNNSLYPNDFEYKASCQPALVYAVIVDPSQKGKEFYLNPIGHSHFSGQNGDLFTDITTITTAKEIAHKVYVKIK